MRLHHFQGQGALGTEPMPGHPKGPAWRWTRKGDAVSSLHLVTSRSRAQPPEDAEMLRPAGEGDGGGCPVPARDHPAAARASPSPLPLHHQQHCSRYCYRYYCWRYGTTELLDGLGWGDLKDHLNEMIHYYYYYYYYYTALSYVMLCLVTLRYILILLSEHFITISVFSLLLQ